MTSGTLGWGGDLSIRGDSLASLNATNVMLPSHWFGKYSRPKYIVLTNGTMIKKPISTTNL